MDSQPDLGTLADRLAAYEGGQLNDEETIALFQELVTSGLVWSLQGHYGRMAQRFILAGLVTDPVQTNDRHNARRQDTLAGEDGPDIRL